RHLRATATAPRASAIPTIPQAGAKSAATRFAPAVPERNTSTVTGGSRNFGLPIGRAIASNAAALFSWAYEMPQAVIFPLAEHTAQGPLTQPFRVGGDRSHHRDPVHELDLLRRLPQRS